MFYFDWCNNDGWMILKFDVVFLNYVLRFVEKICKLFIEIKLYRWEFLI